MYQIDEIVEVHGVALDLLGVIRLPDETRLARITGPVLMREESDATYDMLKPTEVRQVAWFPVQLLGIGSRGDVAAHWLSRVQSTEHHN